MKDKASRPKFFQKTFLMTNTKFEVILKMPFLKISHAVMSFGEKTITWKTYITSKTLPTTKQVQIVDLKEFVIVALDINSKTFVADVAIQEREKMPKHSEK